MSTSLEHTDFTCFVSVGGTTFGRARPRQDNAGAHRGARSRLRAARSERERRSVCGSVREAHRHRYHSAFRDRILLHCCTRTLYWRGVAGRKREAYLLHPRRDRWRPSCMSYSLVNCTVLERVYVKITFLYLLKSSFNYTQFSILASARQVLISRLYKV